VSDLRHLAFEIVGRFRPFALIAPGFEADTSAWTETETGLFLAHTGPPAPYLAISTGPASMCDSLAVGLATESDDHLLVRWLPDTSSITLQVRRSGATRVLRRKKLALSGCSAMAFVLCGSRVTALVNSGSGWRPVLSDRSRVAEALDLREEELLSRYRYAWAGPGSGPGKVEAGLFGHTGLRDPHLVQRADGTPYVRGGRQFMTWTSAGLGYFPQAHWTVWSFAPGAAEQMRLESKLFSRRGGRVLGDHAGHIVRDGDHWHMAVSSWGDFGEGPIHVRHLTTTTDLLSGVHVLDTTPLGLPTRYGAWDPGLLLADGVWHVAYVESPSQTPFDFHPALARTVEKQWTSGLEPVPLEGDYHHCEGPVLVRAGDHHWLVASDQASRSFPIFALDGQRVGRLAAPYPTNIPHPQLVPDPGGGWFLVTFDGTQFSQEVTGYGGHGDVIVMHSVGASRLLGQAG
jgi:hypothetical protein